MSSEHLMVFSKRPHCWLGKLLLSHHPQIRMQVGCKPHLPSHLTMLQGTVCNLEHGTLHLPLWNFILLPTVHILACPSGFESWFCSLRRRAQRMMVWGEQSGLGERAMHEWCCRRPSQLGHHYFRFFLFGSNPFYYWEIGEGYVSLPPY